ncbi:hypothetical protein ABEV09_04070 [Schinkia azotoformans]|uniref:hypothetical protein n=1 Tax=Schinkia azotoformans TaxID=1454 RepID=UPI003D27EF15
MGTKRYGESLGKRKKPSSSNGRTVRDEHREQDGERRKLTTDEFIQQCAIILDKTIKQIEEEYYWIDLPSLIELKNQEKAKEILENIQVSTFPHISDESTRKQILEQYKKQLPKVDSKQEYKSAQDQYEALKKRKFMS